jgi:hypothetical protein
MPLAAVTLEDLVPPIPTILVAVLTAFVTWYVPAWKASRDARIETARVLRNTRDPLLRAAFDLQSRFYNIVARDFLGTYLSSDRDDERQYALMSTLWLVGQYLGWVEILRREVQYLDLGSRSHNRQLQLHLSDISAALASDSRRQDGRFIVFRADQRAIGEFMVTTRDLGGEVRRPDCLGYSEFLAKFREIADGNAKDAAAQPTLAWARRFEHDMGIVSAEPESVTRLITVQRRLIDLVDLLDADRVRYPELDFRGRLRSTATPRRAPHQVAHFLWPTDPWPTVEAWAREVQFKAEDGSGHERTYRGRRGVTLRRTEVRVSRDDNWLTIVGFSSRRRSRRVIDGSLRSNRSRMAVNQLLSAFDRPVVADGATVPARLRRSLVRHARRLLRTDQVPGS